MRRICFLIAALLLAATSLQAQKFITNLTVVGSKDYKEASDAVYNYERRGYHRIEQDLNEGANGAYIYLMYTTETRYGSPITDLYIKFGNENLKSIVRWNACGVILPEKQMPFHCTRLTFFPTMWAHHPGRVSVLI